LKPFNRRVSITDDPDTDQKEIIMKKKESYFSISRTLLTLGVVVALLCAGTTGPAGAQEARPLVMGTNGMVAAGHYLVADVGIDILKKGGNAFDAGAAMNLAAAVLEIENHGFFGEITQLLYSVRDRRAYAIDGGVALPKSVDVAWFKEKGIDKIPGVGLFGAGVPSAPDATVTLLDRFGTISFTEAAKGAIRLATEGFPMSASQLNGIKNNENLLKKWPGSVELFFRNGKLPQVGDIMVNHDLANQWRGMGNAEQKALEEGKSRSEALKAARDYFYKGPIAKAIVKWNQENEIYIDDLMAAYRGNLTMEDFETYSANVETPWTINYHGYDVHKAGPWTQGPVFLMTLNLLKQFDLKKLGYGTADYWHVLTECWKLAHADKIEWLGDDKFIAVPKEGLLSEKYAQERAKLVDMKKAAANIKPGDPWAYNDTPKPKTYPYLPGGYVPAKTFSAPSFWTHMDDASQRTAANPKNEVMAGTTSALDTDDTSQQLVASLGYKDAKIYDTTGIRAADRWGNIWSSTPSGGWLMSNPVIPGLGTPLGSRVQMAYVDRTDHARSYVPGARIPSTSITATVVTKDGVPYMAIGMPGGDQQDGVTIQDFIAVVDFGKEIQAALELPHMRVFDTVSLFYPHERARVPLAITVSGNMPPDVVAELKARGHKVTVNPGPYYGSSTTIITVDRARGVIFGAAAPGWIGAPYMRTVYGW